MSAGTEPSTATSPDSGGEPVEQWSDEVREQRRNLLRTQVWLAVSVLVVLLALAVLATIPATAILGTSLLVAAAATACGALVGFLFGIPRILDDERTRRSVRTAAVSPNTNLEQISDWLTKILVGVGLVQFNAIGAATGRLVDTIATVYEPAAHATVLAGTLVVLPTIIGFLASYIGARTWLFEMFNQFDGGVVSLVRHQVHEAMVPVRAEVDQVQQDQRTLRELLPVLDAQLDSRGPEPRREVLDDVLTKATPAQRDHAFRAARKACRALEGDELTRRRAIAVFEALVAIDPDRNDYRGELGITLADVGEDRAALAALDETIARRGAPTKSDWYEFHRARVRLNLTPVPDNDTATAVRDDLAVAWRKSSFRAYANKIFADQDPDDPEYQLLDRMRPYLPAGAGPSDGADGRAAVAHRPGDGLRDLSPHDR